MFVMTAFIIALLHSAWWGLVGPPLSLAQGYARAMQLGRVTMFIMTAFIMRLGIVTMFIMTAFIIYYDCFYYAIGTRDHVTGCRSLRVDC